MTNEISTVQKLINTAIEFIVNYSFQVVGAIIILIVGMLIANWISRVLMQFFEKKHFDITLAKFIAAMIRIGILTFATLIALGKFGITITPFVAALSAMAFGMSFAFQGPLSNYGAGLSIIISRPFVVGDTISVAGVSGVVQEVKLAATTLTNEDGIRITIPSNHIVGEIMQNSQKNKVAETVVGISYDSDPAEAIRVIRDVLNKFQEVTKNPEPQVGIKEFGDSAINIGYRYWVPTVKFFHISYEVNLAIFNALQAAKISIPFPQREVRILSQSS